MRPGFVVALLFGVLSALAITGAANGVGANGTQQANEQQEYLLLATKRTSSAQEEMMEAADQGYRFANVMGGDTAWGGSEVVVVMSRTPETAEPGRFEYRLLATSRTSTMQRELQEASDAGFSYVGQTVFSSTFGGSEVVVILERDTSVDPPRYEYKLLATSRTGTMQEELREAGDAGYRLIGMTVAETAFGGSELVCIMRRGRSE